MIKLKAENKIKEDAQMRIEEIHDIEADMMELDNFNWKK